MKRYKNYILITSVLFISMISAHLVRLSVVGPKTREITLIKKEQQDIKTKNESLKAEILKLQSSNKVLEDLGSKTQLEVKVVKYVKKTDSISAQN